MSAPAWDDGCWQPLPSLPGSTSADLCVVGLGGSGLAAVAAACDAGLNVVGIDTGAVAAGAAGRNGGFLLAGLARFHHQMCAAVGREVASELYRATLTEITRMQAQTPEHVRITGSLRIADSVEELADCESQHAALRADGLAVERYDGPEGRGLLIPTDGVFNPLARARALAREGLDAGVRLYEKTRAVEMRAGRVVTDTGIIECHHVIVAVDGRLEALFPDLSDRVCSVRLQMLGTEPTRDVQLQRPVYSRWGYDYWQQLPDGRIVLGGARDHAMAEEWTLSAEPTPLIQRALEALLRERLRVGARITHRWAACVGYTPDSLPLVTERAPGFWVVGGYNGTGNVVGALCARAVVEQMHRGRSSWLETLRRAQRAAAGKSDSERGC